MAFEFRIQTTTANETFTVSSLGVTSFGDHTYSDQFNAVIDWGDGGPTSSTTTFNDNRAHTYATAGTYTISITGTFPHVSFRYGSGGSTANAQKVIEVIDLGNVGWRSLYRAFISCSNMTSFSLGLASYTQNVLSFQEAWSGCNDLTSFPSISLAGLDANKFATSNMINSMYRTWHNCTSLTSFTAPVGLDQISPTNNTDVWLNETWYNCNNLTSFPNIVGTENIQVFFETWEFCTNLTSFPLIDTSGATRMEEAWKNCSSLTSFPLINTSSVTSFKNAWRSCTNLTSFPLIDTSSGLTFYNTWGSCSSLTSFPAIDLSSAIDLQLTWFVCSNLTSFPSLASLGTASNFSSTWGNCSSLTSFPLLDFSNATNLYQTWTNCSNLTGAFPAINTSNVSSTEGFTRTWDGCVNLTSFPIIDCTANAKLLETWQGCSSLTSFPVINTSSIEDFDQTWEGCSNLTSFPLIDTSNATRFDETWKSCSSLTSFPLINTPNLNFIFEAWQFCSNLTSFSLIDTSSVTAFTRAWDGCSNLTSFPLIDTSSAAGLSETWKDCSGLTSFPSINTSNVENFTGTWRNCNSLASFPLIDLTKATILEYTWELCTSFTSFPSLTSTDELLDMRGTWKFCSNISILDVSKFIVESVTDFNELFSSGPQRIVGLEGWKPVSAQFWTDMMAETRAQLTTTEYSKLLLNWSALIFTNSPNQLEFGTPQQYDADYLAEQGFTAISVDRVNDPDPCSVLINSAGEARVTFGTSRNVVLFTTTIEPATAETPVVISESGDIDMLGSLVLSGTTGTITLANLTTTERNALTVANGQLVYNTTVNRIQGYQNGAWINLDDGTAG